MQGDVSHGHFGDHDMILSRLHVPFRTIRLLSDELKLEIQSAYRQLLDNKGYSPRWCQRQMVADIANTLGNVEVDEDGGRISQEAVTVIEAGTGTGKTVAYGVSALPLAKALDKRLVIATATIALQEQIVGKDLPDLREESGLDFSFALAKGRRRYLCLSRLDRLLQEQGGQNRLLPLYDDEFETDGDYQVLYESMLDRYGRGEWDGDRDSWPSELEAAAWMPVSTDHSQCTGRQCTFYENCVFYRAREQIYRVDCIVTNQDLVLSDLLMGGGVVLPDPEDTIYIFDEGHHLPRKAIEHLSSFVALDSTSDWLATLPDILQRLQAETGDQAVLYDGRYVQWIEDLQVDLGRLKQSLLLILEDAGGRQYRFPNGQVPGTIREFSDALAGVLNGLHERVAAVVNDLEQRLADSEGDDQLEYWLALIGGAASRLEGAVTLLRSWAVKDGDDAPPMARWFSVRDNDDVSASSSPVAVRDDLHELLWTRAFSAVVTSATLSVGGDFRRYALESGVPQKTLFRALPSPFRYEEQAELNVPALTADPRDADAHTEMVSEMLPALCEGCRGVLVLFTSWRQMLAVKDMLSGEMADRVMAQGDQSRAEIISRHRERVDDDRPSVIFGLASFAEGVDLPGEYCDHVIVAKIPFAVPDDPVGATLCEWIDAQGGNSFSEVMIPDAAIRMVQACGRLIRTETDTGRVTILDRRLVTQRYGETLLSALPPFRRVINR